MNKRDLPDHILRDISIAVQWYSDVKGQQSLKERIRKALLYQESAKESKKLSEVTG